MTHRRYLLPSLVAQALERLFEESVSDIIVIEYSLYARAHVGMAATTRPGRIFVTGSGESFARTPELLLHEYFHVVRQWRPGRLTRCRYLIESMRRGYWANSFEREAREFTADALPHYLTLLGGL